MIAETLERIAHWRRRERLAVEMQRMGANVTTTPEYCRGRRRALVVEALEMRRLARRFREGRC